MVTVSQIRNFQLATLLRINLCSTYCS